MFSVKDKIIVITGGMGQLGQQFGLSLLERGAKVAVLDVNVNVESKFSHFDESQVLKINADVTNKSSIKSALSEIACKWKGAPEGLINNAALDSPPDAPEEDTVSFEKFPEKSWDDVMDVNVKGVFLTCQVIGGAMAKRGGGSIINIGSTYGVVSPDHRIYEYKHRHEDKAFFKPVVYSASKSALVNLTKYLGVYWGDRGVRANLMALGGVYNNQDEEFVEAYASRVPMGRMANDDEYNGMVVYLMSNASSYMTGATIMLDGGWTAW